VLESSPHSPLEGTEFKPSVRGKGPAVLTPDVFVSGPTARIGDNLREGRWFESASLRNEREFHNYNNKIISSYQL
jgi:hypothetical protein